MQDQLSAQPFLRRDGLVRGIPRGQLDRANYVRPFHGVRVPRVSSQLADTEDLLDSCRNYAPRLLPGQYFSHGTALALWGVPVPREKSLELHVSAHRPNQAPRTKGVLGHRLRAREVEVASLHGIPVLTVAEAWVQVLGTWRHDDLVIAADRIVTSIEALATREELRELARTRRRVSASEKVLRDVRVGSESPQETRLRLRMLRAGLPEPELGYELFRTDGTFVARFVCAYPELRVAIEYDGRQHAHSTQQFERDADRWHEISAEGWILVRVLNHHLFNDDGQVAIARIKEALRQRGWRN
jgi:very-short-patch-repair endonuclease